MSAPQWIEMVLTEHLSGDYTHMFYEDPGAVYPPVACRCGWRRSGSFFAHHAAVLWAEFTAHSQQAREDVARAISVEAQGHPDYYGAWTDEADAAIAALLTAMGGAR